MRKEFEETLVERLESSPTETLAALWQAANLLDDFLVIECNLTSDDEAFMMEHINRILQKRQKL